LQRLRKSQEANYQTDVDQLTNSELRFTQMSNTSANKSADKMQKSIIDFSMLLGLYQVNCLHRCAEKKYL